ncbi:MAG: helix-turn-helix transcriptional regulator [Thermoanaerobaculales bacterium]|jgi:AraC-like DNA-binding protein|nr:helix-turn-helix transcriptional regulator [Thermoanaerobaculales bacterium]
MSGGAALGTWFAGALSGPGAEPPGGWAATAIVAVAALAGAAVAAAALRAGHHRRRRNALDDQLADLEGVLVGLGAPTPATPPTAPQPAASDLVDDPADDPEVLRGPLSTAISILRRDLGHELPAPDRTDLRAARFLYQHLGRPLTPADLAHGLNLSLRTLQRGLSTTLGCTPRELILAVKMREAKRRLIDDGLRVQEAARAVGFDDPFHFSRRFKAYYGVPPTEMQARAAQPAARRQSA